MEVVAYRHPLFLEHRPGPYHPERPDRLVAIHRSLESAPPARVAVRSPSPADRTVLERIHRPDYLDRVAATAGKDGVWLDPDTQTSARSWEAAQLAAGAVCEGVEAVVRGEAAGAFALVRPPGHHAESDAAMGFCLLNNVALGAAHAVEALGLSRVLVLDPDVHHGNGTQRSFWLRRDVLYVSSHRFPFYPGTGWVDEVGAGEGEGHTVNLPMPTGMEDADLLYLYREIVEPVVDAYRPELILVSAGFDTWYDDPLGGMRITEDGYRALFGLFADWARRYTGRGLVMALEGGYDLAGVVTGVRVGLEVMAGVAEPVTLPGRPRPAAREVADRVRTALSPFW